MKPKIFLLALIFIFLAGCTQQVQQLEQPIQPAPVQQLPETVEQSNLLLTIKDQPSKIDVNAVTKLEITFRSVELHSADSNAWTGIDLNATTFDLLQLQNDEALLAKVRIVPGNYDMLRIQIEKAVADVNGGQVGVKVPSGKLRVKINAGVESDSATLTNIDFDVFKSLAATGSGKLILKPVLYIETASDVDADISTETEEGKTVIKVKKRKGKLEFKAEIKMNEEGETEEQTELSAENISQILAEIGFDSFSEIRINDGVVKVEGTFGGKEGEAIFNIAIGRIVKLKIEGKEKEKEAQEDKNETEIEIEIEDNRTEVEIESASGRTEFELQTTNLEEVLAVVSQRTGLSVEEVRAIAKIKK